MGLQNVTVSDFESEVLQSEEPVLVDFWAEWCGPCKKMLPVLETLDEQTMRVVKVNADTERDLVDRFGIRSIPTMILFNNGEVLGSLTGAQPLANIEEYVHKTLGNYYLAE